MDLSCEKKHQRAERNRKVTSTSVYPKYRDPVYIRQNCPLDRKFGANIVNAIDLAPWTSGDEPDSTFLNSGNHHRVCYSKNHATIRFHHLNAGTQFISAQTGTMRQDLVPMSTTKRKCSIPPVVTHHLQETLARRKS